MPRFTIFKKIFELNYAGIMRAHQELTVQANGYEKLERAGQLGIIAAIKEFLLNVNQLNLFPQNYNLTAYQKEEIKRILNWWRRKELRFAAVLN